VMGSDIEKQDFLGLGDYFNNTGSKTDLSANNGVFIEVHKFAKWASRHLGIPESSIPSAIAGLLKRRVIHNVPGSEDESHIFIEKRIILRMQ
ncbi:MAG: hypothetical protein JEY91_18765, partial [Spirochaetaceae bacterium]|nr:hypothetical protein [Spirochaetaceae bacterium]